MLALRWAGGLSWEYSTCDLNSTQNTKNANTVTASLQRTVMLHGKNDKKKHAFLFQLHDYWLQQVLIYDHMAFRCNIKTLIQTTYSISAWGILLILMSHL